MNLHHQHLINVSNVLLDLIKCKPTLFCEVSDKFEDDEFQMILKTTSLNAYPNK